MEISRQTYDLMLPGPCLPLMELDLRFLEHVELVTKK